MALKRVWKLLKGKQEEKQLEAMQVEVFAACNIQCTFCPTTYWNHPGKVALDLEIYKKLVPYFSWYKWVYLQGWGEPLLHRDFWQMVELAKGNGVKVGFTTNGTLLHQETIDNIFATGVDLVSTSIAGATQEMHGRLRVGSDLKEIGGNIASLLKQREAKGLDWPKVSISYMLTKDSISELPGALELAMRWGVDDFYAMHIDNVFDHQAEEHKIFHYKDEKIKGAEQAEEEELRWSQYQEYIDTANQLASKENFSFRYYKLGLEKQEPACELNPNKFVFITAWGDVTPCTSLGRMENPKVFQGQDYNFSCHSFGNLQQLDFGQIWASEEFEKFRQPFLKREQAMERLMSAYTDHDPSLVRLKLAEKEYQEQLEQNPLPQPCQVCPKAYGI